LYIAVQSWEGAPEDVFHDDCCVFVMRPDWRDAIAGLWCWLSGPCGGVVNLNLKYPQWQQPLAAALLEFNAQKLCEKIQKAEEEITRRFRDLEFDDATQEERRLLHDGLNLIRLLKDGR
jgi:hypothetical protein